MIRLNVYLHVECNFKVIDTKKYRLVVFNMAAIFQDGRHRLYELLLFASKWQQTVKMIFGINDMH